MDDNIEQVTADHLSWEEFMPGISIDCVIFGYHRRELKILILEYKKSGIFALPGGFLRKNEELNDAAKRVLFERTGLADIYLYQFHTFGSLKRSDTRPMQTVLEKNNTPFDDGHFLLQRFISVSYYALVDFKQAEPVADVLSDSCRWYDTDKLPQLMLDHHNIFEKALKHLQINIDRSVVGLNLLDDTFTMSELQNLYETILGEKLNRTGFHRKMMLSGRLKRLGKKKTGKPHRSPYVYRFTED
ncbi:MAG: NUDIX hydrolase [Balneolaceae bacterium]|nr:MAG: NUDIX hydrolase [Balneolaceae bacterium]